MPYLNQVHRKWLQPYIPGAALSEGEINYVIQLLLNRYVRQNGLTYSTLASAVGVLETAKAEFIRRVVNPYEDIKIAEEGDIAWPEVGN